MLYQQPQSGPLQIDWSNPIANGLKFLNSHGAGGVLAPPGNVVTPVGRGLQASGVNATLYDTGANGISGTNYSLLAVGTLVGSLTQSAIDDDNDAGGQPRCFQLVMNIKAAGLITFDTGGNPYFATSSAMTDAQLASGFVMGATVNGNSIAVFQNGVKTAATASNTQRVPTGNFRIGQHKGSGTQGWATGGLALVAGWSRALTDAEMASLNANPWQLFLDEDEEDEALWTTLVAGGIFNVSILESGSAIDVSALIATFSTSRLDGGSVVDAQTTGASTPLSWSDSASASDSTSQIAASSATAIDSGAVVEMQSGALSANSTAADSTAAVDQIGSTSSFTVAGTDIGTGMDSVVATGAAASASQAETGAVIDQQSAAGAFGVAGFDAGAATDSTGLVGSSSSATVSESGPATDARAGVYIRAATTLDLGAMSDTISAVMAGTASLVEAGSIADLVAGQMIALMTVAEMLAAVEVLGAIVPAGAISAFMRYTVEPEDRVFTIGPDNRIYVVDAENRTFTIN